MRAFTPVARPLARRLGVAGLASLFVFGLASSPGAPVASLAGSSASTVQAPPYTALYLDGQASAGFANEYVFTRIPPVGSFSATYDGNAVAFSSSGTDGFGSITITLAAPLGQPLTVGQYTGAVGLAARAGSQPGIDGSYIFAPCGTPTGHFDVEEASYSGLTVVAFAASFALQCAGDSSPVTGELRFASSVTYVARDMPLNLDLGDQEIGTVGAVHNYVVSNTGTAPLTVSSALLEDPANFKLASNGCAGSVAAGATCNIGFRFTPQPTDQPFKFSRLNLTDSTYGGTHVALLSAHATAHLTVRFPGPGIGSVFGNPMNRCSATCQVAIEPGTYVYMQPETAVGSTFEGWSDPCGTAFLCSFVITEPTTIDANFDLEPLHPLDVSGGGFHTCAVISDETVRCWGANAFGELGNGSTVESSVPVAVTGLSGVVAVTSGATHSCALLSDHTIKCWGHNQHGQLGNGSNTDSSTPVVVPGIDDAVAVSAGGDHTCAVRNTDVTVFCWGKNASGELGDGTTTDSSTPVGPITQSNVVAAGENGTCSVAGAEIDCWGDVGFKSTSPQAIPITLPYPDPLRGLTVGSDHACARYDTGIARCWGRNDYGQLGNGKTGSAPTVTQVAGLNGVQAITAGWFYSCAVASGVTKCWGDNEFGQLGDGTTTNRLFPASVGILGPANRSPSTLHHVLRPSARPALRGVQTARPAGTRASRGLDRPAAVSSNAPEITPRDPTHAAVAISAGGYQTCALIADATLRCWGDDTYGQLGDATVGFSTKPVSPYGLGSASAVDAAGFHTCALLSGGAGACWGDNVDGELGNGTFVDSATPVTVSGLTATSLGLGFYHSCARLPGGAAKCWGYNGLGELGDGSYTSRTTPVAVGGISTASVIRGGGLSTCALLTSGQVRCWGLNEFGQLGNGTATDSKTPVTVSGITNATGLSVGWEFACALISGGTVRCWGANGNGQLGNNSTTDRHAPVAVSGITSAIAISAGDSHACAVLSGGTVKCWGWNAGGQLGDGSTTDRHVPVAVTGLSGVTAVAAGGVHSCARIGDGTVKCWGANFSGQLGTGTDKDSATPVTVTGLAGATQIATAWNHSCARLGTGAIKCWGDDFYGTLGDGITGYSPFPIPVRGLAPKTTGATYVALSPTRLLDTRPGGTGLSGKFVSGTPRTFQVAGRGGVPADAVAVTGNLTVVGQTKAGFVSLGPIATSNPTTSTINFPVGDVRANGVTVTLGGGKLSAVYKAVSPGATTDLLFDVTGYYMPSAAGATYIALSPARLLDTRSGNGLNGPFVSGTPRTFQVAGRGGVPAGAVAVTGNLTVVGQTKAGFVSLGPVATSDPKTSTINFPVGDIRANGVTVTLGGGTLSATFKSSIAGATTALLFDVTGYYVPGAAGATFVALTPARLLDTRANNGLNGLFVPGMPRTFQVTGRGAIPADAVAITGNLTVVDQTKAGYVSLGPIATSNPMTSTINFPVGDVRANGVTMSLPGRGRLAAVAIGAKTDLLFDATGYFIK